MKNNLVKDEFDLSELRGKLTRFVKGRIKNQHEVEDIVQETFVRMAQYADWTEIESPTAYALQVAKSIIAKNYQVTARVEIATESDSLIQQLISPTDQERHFIDQEKLRVIEQALEKMPALRRDVFLCRKLDGKSREAISLEFNLSLEAVKKHINRATVDLTLALHKLGLLDE